MGFSFKYSRLDFTYLREFELANGNGDTTFIVTAKFFFSTNGFFMVRNFKKMRPIFANLCENKNFLKI